MKPIVSVCIPTYNGSKYLKECLDSVLAQTFTDFELLVVDDQSSDETLSIAQAYAVNDHRIRVVQNKHNLGLVGNWNRCVELAQGEWIKFVFQDDLIEPVCLEKMLAASKTESAIIFCRRNFIFEPGTTEDTRQIYKDYIARSSMDKLFPKLTEIPANDYCEATLDQIYLNFVGEPTAVMLRRSVFHQFGYFNPYLIMLCDFEFWTRVAIHTGIIYVPETLATFRVHGSATTATNRDNRKYRGWVLDPLVIIHEFAYHPAYAPLRAVASRHQPPVNLTNLLANEAYEARRIAERAVADSVNPNSSLVADWEYILQFYPILSIVSKRSLLERIISHCLWRWSELKRQIKVLPEIQSRKIIENINR